MRGPGGAAVASTMMPGCSGSQSDVTAIRQSSLLATFLPVLVNKGTRWWVAHAALDLGVVSLTAAPDLPFLSDAPLASAAVAPGSTMGLSDGACPV